MSQTELALPSSEAIDRPSGGESERIHDRGWLMRRTLRISDASGLALAFTATALLFGPGAGRTNHFALGMEYLLFLLTIPAWLLAAKLYELYDRDEERAEHTTFDDFVNVLHLVTLGSWTLFVGAHLTGLADPELEKVASFWAMALVLMTAGRALARAYCRRHPAYIQNTVIVGAGEVGQLVARKLEQHSEYGMRLVGFVDADPRDLRADISSRRILGTVDGLPDLIRRNSIQRVIVAFSRDTPDESVALIRKLKHLNVHIDIVPRFFDVVGPNVLVHTVEGLPLLGLPASKLLPFSRTIKRAQDIAGASVLLLLTAPLFALFAWWIRRDSPGPVLFRQERLGEGMRPFTALKFRTMVVGTDDRVHREFIKSTMSSKAAPAASGLYKLDRPTAITRSGRWLRKTSLDELPQLINVLRGEMSLVGPRPCISYETEGFSPHHFERFLVPAGITGLWQVTARARATFGEALDLDVAYARNWSLGLDLRLLLRTPFVLLRQRKATS